MMTLGRAPRLSGGTTIVDLPPRVRGWAEQEVVTWHR
jgi:hypothetical protein